MTYTDLSADEKTNIRRSRDLSRERRNGQRARAARRMLRERRRHQSDPSAELCGDTAVMTDPMTTPK